MWATAARTVTAATATSAAGAAATAAAKRQGAASNQKGIVLGMPSSEERLMLRLVDEPSGCVDGDKSRAGGGVELRLTTLDVDDATALGAQPACLRSFREPFFGCRSRWNVLSVRVPRSSSRASTAALAVFPLPMTVCTRLTKNSNKFHCLRA